MGWAAAPPSPPAAAASKSGPGGDINPSILLIIVILSVIFFISGLLHLLVRFLLKPATRNAEEQESATALQGQLQQLFHLHDAGVDQSFIDTLPVFIYKAIVGAKDPFDCAVCLCEFEADDKLRLLPKCSHAFHLECIDTWLLSHSTCPLCRSNLLPDHSACGGIGGGAVLVLESAGESSREVAGDRDAGGEEETVSCTEDAVQKGEEEPTGAELKVVSVKLGKYRNVDGGAAAAAGGGEGSSSLDERRCFSMGSFEYVMDETSRLQVAIKPPARNPAAKNPGHRLAMSECDWSSRREGFKGFEQLARSGGGGAIASNSQRVESFSISKIWLRWPRKDKPEAGEGPRRAVSFRLSAPHSVAAAAVEEQKANCGSSRRSSDACWEKNGSEFGFDVEAGSCDGGAAVSRAGETPSFARRTLLWLVGRHHKVVNHV